MLPALALMAAACDLTEMPQAEAGRNMIFGSETGLENYTYSFYNNLPDQHFHFMELECNT